ncbi:MAG: hypothetical protein JNK85_09960 [Verrucomicrobiales bacterium]|nr:hypothetical protein [Verrucomicrobiales bacterium]
MSHPTRFPRLLALLRVLLLAAGSGAVILALFYGVANWRGSREWRAERQRIESLGRRTDITALAPPAVPDNDNFAMIPLLRPLLDYRRLQGDLWAGIQWNDTNGYALANETLALGESLKRRFKEPAERSWTRGERVDLRAWQAALRDPKQRPALTANLANTGQDTNLMLLPEGTPPGREILQVLGSYAGSFDALSKGIRRAHSQFPVHYDEVYAALLPHLHLLKRFTTRFSLRAVALLAEGHPDSAAEDVITSLRLAEAIRTESFLISQIVRQANLDLALQPLWEGVITQAWSDVHLSAFQKQLESIDFIAGWRAGIETERAAAAWAVHRIASSWESRRAMCEMYASIGHPPGAPTAVGFPLPYALLAPRGWFYGSLVDASKSLETLETATPRDAPDLRSTWRPSDRPIRISRLLYFSLLANGLGDLSAAFVNTVRRQTHLRIATTACALERHRLAHGTYPDTLGSLVPNFLPAVPVDPIDDQPLRYRREAKDRFALWSVGENGRDDSGAFPTGGETTPYEGDWVWRWPAPVAH